MECYVPHYKTLSEEQWLVQPMYNLLSSDAFDLLRDIATKKGMVINLSLYLSNDDKVDKSWTTDYQVKPGTVPEFPETWNLKNPISRWHYGMMIAQQFKPILTIPMYRFPQNANYLNGKLFLQGVQQYNSDNPNEKYSK